MKKSYINHRPTEALLIIFVGCITLVPLGEYGLLDIFDKLGMPKAPIIFVLFTALNYLNFSFCIALIRGALYTLFYLYFISNPLNGAILLICFFLCIFLAYYFYLKLTGS